MSLLIVAVVGVYASSRLRTTCSMKITTQYSLSNVNVDTIQLGLTFIDREIAFKQRNRETFQVTTESIYKFVEQPQAKKAMKEVYKSKYDPNGPLIGSTFCMQGTTVVDGKGFHSLKQVSSIFVLFVVCFVCCCCCVASSIYL